MTRNTSTEWTPCLTAALVIAAAWLMAPAAAGQDTTTFSPGVQLESSAVGTPTTPQMSPVPTTTEVPQSLSDLIGHARQMFAFAKAGDWAAASDNIMWFDQGVTDVKLDVPGETDSKKTLDTAVAALNDAIKVKDAQSAMIAANAITWTGVNMSQRYEPTIPIGVQRMEYYARQLDVWTRAENAAMLSRTVADMRGAWQVVRPQVVARSGESAATPFDQMLAELSAAVTPADYAPLVVPAMAQVARVEQVFVGPQVQVGTAAAGRP